MTCADARSLLSCHLDNERSPDRDALLMEHLHECLACQTVRREMEADHALLAQHWTAVPAPAGLSDRILRSLPPRHAPKRTARLLRRPAPVLAGVLVVLIVAIGVTMPPVRAGISTLLESVSPRETSDPPAERRLGEGEVLTLDEAQQRVPWRIRIPGSLPEGYRMAGVLAGEVQSFADGATVVLYYVRGDGADAPQIRIVQRRMLPDARADLPVERGASSYVRVNGRDALLVDGAWQEQDGRMVWVRGSFIQLVLEEDGLLITIEADPRDGWDAGGLIRIAESLR